MNILAIDYGTKRIGLAKWNSTAKVVLPAGVVENIEQTVELIKINNIDLLVIGMPYALNSQTDNANMIRVKNFIIKLSELTQIKIEVFDERFSSQQADKMGGTVSRDEKSAMVILQNYLDKKNF
ncbi:MAG: Holliday junction resolvase RuvX [Candidatus Magasanikbacteria bacterium CG10_big_fil_rev_8_21_14_0_10_40_10]|uniref:Putative pre-16S rRNA nuclease n=1 Tax=Candidatus Magasanikbacteria bacterium CG10_big_fil_rev_8_21_14_0_10_40_10 TaxID=1974648 RepID=A0A2M6W564_9BACT|nr:MAG: Holliday junction resolvase RuvX [Candidatus Magasanikbacteria bacterium CG10_big_fil_rev_8_21_14_0_10_40_10]